VSFQPPKGTDDVLAPASYRWRSLLLAWEEMARRFGYPLVITPTFEATNLFERGVGEATEVVEKQMYSFTDRGGRSLTLRPEATAPVVRAYLNAGAPGVWKGAYSGPMFRYERPQGGRRRQFWQVGIEYLGVAGPMSDVEAIELGYRFIVEAGVPDLSVRINSLGDSTCRPAYVERLRAYLEEREDILCDDSRKRMQLNPLRVLDCKVCAPRLADAPTIELCGPCTAHHGAVRDGLTRLEIPFIDDPRLVRGLDYYTRTAFEYIATGLQAAQNAVGGGGRYDGLAEALGGKPVAGVGFALGLDRMIMASTAEVRSELEVYVVSESGPMVGLEVASKLRAAGVAADFDPEGRSVKAQFRAATRSAAPITMVVTSTAGPHEVRRGEERTMLAAEEVAGWIRQRR
jgi:histidyl-tRNA synthetase